MGGLDGSLRVRDLVEVVAVAGQGTRVLQHARGRRGADDQVRVQVAPRGRRRIMRRPQPPHSCTAWPDQVKRRLFVRGVADLE